MYLARYLFIKLIMKYLYIILTLSLSSCGLLSESTNEVKYTSEEYGKFKPSSAPDYKLLKSWAVHPKKNNEVLEEFINEEDLLDVNIFFIHPTLFWDKKNTDWNSDINDLEMAESIISSSVKYQASAWASTGNLYAPLYRQAHLRVFRESFWFNGGEQAYELAYSDIKNAFQFFLDKFNNDKPIIIAGHSQGAGHAKRILQDFFDGKPLQKKLIAAYLVGTKITKDDFKFIKPMVNKNETGGFVSWNTFRKVSEKKQARFSYTVNYDWLEGAICSNPITWDDTKKSKYDDHKGFLYLNKKIYPKTVKIEDIDSKVYINIPKMNFFKKILLSSVKDYHKADINLFWEDIRLNSINRAKIFLADEI